MNIPIEAPQEIKRDDRIELKIPNQARDLSHKDWCEKLRTDPAYKEMDVSLVYRFLTRRASFRGFSEGEILNQELRQEDSIKAFNGKIKACLEVIPQSIQGSKFIGFELGHPMAGNLAMPKLYVTIKDFAQKSDFSDVGKFISALKENGFNGQIKVVSDGSRAMFHGDNIVLHGNDDDDIAIAERVAIRKLNEIESIWKGLDANNNSHGYLTAKWIERNKGATIPRPLPAANLAEYNNLQGPYREAPEPGFIRLYRAETNGSPVGDQWTAQRKPLDPNNWTSSNPEVIASHEAEGRWFNDNIQSALYYQKTFGGGRPITFVDIPKEKQESFRASNLTVAKFSSGGPQGMAQEEFFLDRGTADSRQWIGIPNSEMV